MSSSNLRVRLYKLEDSEVWDKLVVESWNGTFLHTRRFLSYHCERFQDISLVIEDSSGQMIGVFPAAIDPAKQDRAISHPGITYGGIVHNGKVRGTVMVKVLHLISETYQKIGVCTLRYKTVPYIYHRVPASDDLYALFRLEAVRYRCDLCSTIDLDSQVRLSRGRTQALKKARNAGVCIKYGTKYLEEFWQILEENKKKYGVKPIHSWQEIQYLYSLFPDNIEIVVGVLNNQVVAGAVLFKTDQVIHPQYGAASLEGYTICALDLIYQHCIEKSKSARVRYFDFGISNENEGHYLNESLDEFKSMFGGRGVVHEFYEINLKPGGRNED